MSTTFLRKLLFIFEMPKNMAYLMTADLKTICVELCQWQGLSNDRGVRGHQCENFMHVYCKRSSKDSTPAIIQFFFCLQLHFLFGCFKTRGLCMEANHNLICKCNLKSMTGSLFAKDTCGQSHREPFKYNNTPKSDLSLCISLSYRLL